MSERFLSDVWYRVGALRPRLRPHLTVHRHRYRGQPWYVVHDLAAARVHRFTPAAYLFIGQLDGKRSVDEVWQDLARSHDEETPSQEDVITLLSQLHQNDLIRYQGAPDVSDLLERRQRQARQVVKQNLMNPLGFRVPLWDPDRFLERTLPAVRFLTGWWGLVLWLGLVLAGSLTAALNWEALAGDVTGQLLSAQNLLIMAVSYPFLKALHELAHGYLAKARGAEVHEMGLMFLVFFPVPYVDASAASAFRSKWHRMAVSIGGIAVETMAASVAVMLWAASEPGMVRAIAHNVALMGGISTVLFNANPLLKFDGYYTMIDLIEIPNLGTRANRYWGHLIQRYLFGARHLRPFAATVGERVWFLLYAPAAFAYRLFVMLGIALMVAGEFFLFGVMLALLSVFNTVVRPAVKHLHHVATSPALRKVRSRAQAITWGTIGIVLGVLLLVPLPLRSVSEGVVWLPASASVRAATDGFLAEVVAARGSPVEPGTVLCRLTHPERAAELLALEWRLRELERRLIVAQTTDRRRSEEVRIHLDEARAEYDRAVARRGDLLVSAQTAGIFDPVLDPGSFVGRFVREGEVIGHVLPPAAERLRVAVRQRDAALMRRAVARVEVKLAGHLDATFRTTLLGDVPSAVGSLPAPALGQQGGGALLVDPADPDGQRLLEDVFVYDLAMPDGFPPAGFGARVLVRVTHGTEPGGAQIYRRLRQLFLYRFNV